MWWYCENSLPLPSNNICLLLLRRQAAVSPPAYHNHAAARQTGECNITALNVTHVLLGSLSDERVVLSRSVPVLSCVSCMALRRSFNLSIIWALHNKQYDLITVNVIKPNNLLDPCNQFDCMWNYTLAWVIVGTNMIERARCNGW